MPRLNPPKLPDPDDPSIAKTLHVTDGDSAAELIGEAGIDGEVLAWRDVLTEGPVPAGLSMVNLGQRRCRFLADRGWAEFQPTRAAMARRDSTLAAAARLRDEVVLWFEHDLHGQLQLVQILDRYAARGPENLRLTLVSVDRVPGVERFIGLGQLDPEQIAALHPQREAVTHDQCRLARRAWDAFRAPDPTGLAALLGEDTAALPFLAAALGRLLAQLPAVGSGLSMTERLALGVLAGGPRTPVDLFLATQDREPAPFMGDLAFWDHLERLGAGDQPLVALDDGGRFVAPRPARGDVGTPVIDGPMIAITGTGRAVLAGRQDWLAFSPPDRWLGGVHLGPDAAIWRWEDGERRLVRDRDAG